MIPKNWITRLALGSQLQIYKKIKGSQNALWHTQVSVSSRVELTLGSC